MVARLSTLQVKKSHLEALQRTVQQELIPLAQQQHGFRGLLVLHRAGDFPEVIIVALWESLQDLEASAAGDFLKTVSAKLLAHTEDSPRLGISRYEVMVAQLST